MVALENIQKEAVKRLTTEGLKAGLHYLGQQLYVGAPCYSNCINFQTQHADLEKRRMKGIIQESDFQFQEANIREGVILLISELTEADIRGPENDSGTIVPDVKDVSSRKVWIEKLIKDLDESHIRTLLKERIGELNLYEDIGEIHLVNVDRKKSIERVWDAYDEKETQDFQFYFLCACPHQMPQSLAERFLFELMHEELDEEIEAINYPRIPDSLRLDFEKWEFKNNLKRSWKKLNKLLEERFKDRFPELNLENFVKTGIPHLEERFVLHAFTIRESNWSDHAGAFFDKLLQTFSSTHEKCPTFLFFFIIYLDKFEEDPLSERQKDIFQTVQRIIQTYSSACSLHKGLAPVSGTDIVDWFDKLGENNLSKIYQVLDTYVAGLVKQETKNYWQNQELDMDVMEYLQEIVYQLKMENR